MRAHSIQRNLRRLALIAMLLLATVPTLGRLLADAPRTPSPWTQMCTLTGMQLLKAPLMDLNAAAASTADDPQAPADGMGGDCPYCSLSASTLLLLLCVLLPASTPNARLCLPWQLAAPRSFLHPSGLGSRGPPDVILKA